MICGYMWLSFVKDFCICYVCVFMSLDLCMWDLCMWDYPALPAITLHKSPSLIPPISLPFPLFMHFSECLRLCLLPTFHLCCLWLLIVFCVYSFTLYVIFSFVVIYITIVFKSRPMSLQRAMYGLLLRAI